MKKNKTFIVISIIVIVIMGIIIFFYSKNKKESTISNQTVSNQSSTSITDQQLSITPILKNKLFFPFISINYNFIYSFQDKGIYFYQTNLANNNNDKIFKDEILGIKSVYPSPNQELVIIFSNYPNKNIKLYNLKEKTISDLSNNIIDLTWQNNTDKIIYSYNNEEGKKFNINIANPDGTKFQEAISFDSFPDGGFFLAADEQNIYYQRLESAPHNGTLHKFDINTKQDKIIYQAATYISFSPNKQKIIATTYNEEGDQTFFLMDNNGSKLANLDISSEVISPFAWSIDNRYIYYFSDDNKFITIDTNTNTKTIYSFNMSNLISSNGYQIDNLIADGKQTLYFTLDDYLYKFILP